MTKFEILNALIEDTQTNPYPPSITLNSLLKKNSKKGLKQNDKYKGTF